MMHDFNSVSGMWSEIQLKERGGRRGGEGTNVEGIKGEKKGEEGEECGEWDREGVAFVHTPAFPRVLFIFFFWTCEGQRRGNEGGGWRRGEGWSEGEGPVWLLSASHVSKPVLKNE